MSLSIIYSRARVGVSSPLVTVETHISNGLPSLSIVGLPETAVKESKDRVRSALINSGFEFPNRRITINLAPADLPKEGGRYDLAIALGILAASHQLPSEQLSQREFIGELALTGDVRSVKGCLPAAMACGKEGRTLYVPLANSEEASLCRSTRLLAADHLLQVCSDIKGDSLLPEIAFDPSSQKDRVIPDLLDVKGQFLARRALEISAAAGLNLLFYGPPGTGKTTIARLLADDSAHLQLRYQATPKFAFGAVATYSSEAYVGQPDSAANEDLGVPDYTVYDLFASYDLSEQLSFRLNVGNVTDEAYYFTAYRSGAFTYIGDARNAQVTVNYEF